MLELVIISLVAFIYTDLDGSVPLWEAMVGGHKSIKKILIDSGADIFCTDVGHLACHAAENNNIELLKELIEYGVDVTKPESSGTTALHAAVCEGNAEIVKFLLDQGAEVDKPNGSGWTPRSLAEHQGHEEIKNIFQNIQENKKTTPVILIPEYGKPNMSCMGRFQSEPAMPGVLGSQESMQQPPNQEVSAWLDSHRRRANTFNNSIFGIISAARRCKYCPRKLMYWDK